MATQENVKTDDKLFEELRGLAIEMHRRCYSHVPQWKPSSTSRGLVSQIDNMVAGLMERLQKTESAVGWVLSPFVTEQTSEAELRKRITYVNQDWDRLNEDRQ